MEEHLDWTYHRDVRVARIGKPHGIRGEVTVEVFTDSPKTRFVKTLFYCSRRIMMSSVPQLTLEQARRNKSILLLSLLSFR